jgi:GNAT superfamily N-acetyltransferase
LIVESLSRSHNRKLFDCGDQEIDRFLREQALHDHEKDMSRTMVLIDETLDRDRIIGYYTLAMRQVTREEIPGDRPRIKRGIPVVLLGQLGIDARFQRRGLGELLLMDAQARINEISRHTGVRAMTLDARNESLARWYEQHDFVRFPGQLRMFKSIVAIHRLNLERCRPSD